jgi:hypothetical protein
MADEMATSSMVKSSAELHAIGECKPCLYLNSKMGCLNGEGCRFCHLPHPKKNRPRPCKAKRNQCKQMVNLLNTLFSQDSQEFQDASERLSGESYYMRSILGRAQQQPPQSENAPAQSSDKGVLFGTYAAAMLSGNAIKSTPGSMDAVEQQLYKH